MSQKIISNLFHYALQVEAENIVLNKDNKEIKISYYLKNAEVEEFFLAKKYLTGIKRDLKLLLNSKDLISENESIIKKAGKFKDKGVVVNFLLSFISLASDEKIIIDCKIKKEKNWRLTELGLNLEDRKNLLKNLKKNQGVIILAGSKNSGKSSTLIALLQEVALLNKTSCLMTDSNPDFDFLKMEISDSSFELLRRADIDIIAIDEVKSKKDLNHAFRLASYGKLVIITIAADSFKNLAQKIKTSNWPGKDKLILLISLQKIIKIKTPLSHKKNKREAIARFKLLNISQNA